MKKIGFSIMIMILSVNLIAQNAESLDLKYEVLGTIQVLLDNPINIGHTPYGNRTIYPIKGGSFEGPKMKGKILANGGDWLLTTDSTSSRLDVRALVQTDDDALLYITSAGFIHINPDKSIYFRTIPIFETSAEKYKWLNHSVVVGVGVFTNEGITYKYYLIK